MGLYKRPARHRYTPDPNNIRLSQLETAITQIKPHLPQRHRSAFRTPTETLEKRWSTFLKLSQYIRQRVATVENAVDDDEY